MKFIVLPFSFTVILTLMSMVFFAKLSHQNIMKYNENSQTIINNLNLYDTIKQEEIKEESQRYLRNSKKYLLLYTVLILIISTVLFFIEKILFSLFISIVSIMSLSIAIFSPLTLTVVESSMRGETLLTYEVNSCVETVLKLLHSQEYGLMFSVLFITIFIPLIKSSTILIYDFLRVFGDNNESYDIIKAFRWWSIVDIAIIAILINFTMVEKSISNEIIVENGVYFFIIYLVLSTVNLYHFIYHKK